MSGPSAWRRRSPVEAIQNTPENHADALAFAVAHSSSYWRHLPHARTGALAGTISWWENDYGTHCSPGDWLVAEDGDLLVYDDAEFREGYAPADPPSPAAAAVATNREEMSAAFGEAMSYLEFWTSDNPAAVALVQSGHARAAAVEFVAQTQAHFGIEPADWSDLEAGLEEQG